MSGNITPALHAELGRFVDKPLRFTLRQGQTRTGKLVRVTPFFTVLMCDDEGLCLIRNDDMVIIDVMVSS